VRGTRTDADATCDPPSASKIGRLSSPEARNACFECGDRSSLD